VHEAFVIRDGNRAEYDGLSVHRAVSAVTDEIAPVLVGAELDDPRSLDRVLIELDGTPDKHRLGGNAIYSTSIALLRAASAALPPIGPIDDALVNATIEAALTACGAVDRTADRPAAKPSQRR
jgi:hypothetical protein